MDYDSEKIGKVEKKLTLSEIKTNKYREKKDYRLSRGSEKEKEM